MGKMKIHGKGGLLDFSKDKLTERNKENSFLDVDWIITGRKISKAIFRFAFKFNFLIH